MEPAHFLDLPKAELHVHLEGAMRPERVLQFAAEEPDHPWTGLTSEELRAGFRGVDFPTFIQQFMTGYSLPTTARRWQQITEDLLEDLQIQGVQQAQIIYSPGVAFQKLGVKLKDIHDGIAAGLATAPRMKICFILDTVINMGVEFMSRTLEAVIAEDRDWIRGFSIGGGQPDLDMRALLPLFHRAEAAGLFQVAHAGEVDPAENIDILLQETNIKRIAHGCSAGKRPETLALLRKHGVTVDVSPTSNIYTGAVAEMEHHPIKAMIERGVQVTLNTDDPLYFDTTLSREYSRAHNEIGLDLETLEGIAAHSLEAFAASY